MGKLGTKTEVNGRRGSRKVQAVSEGKGKRNTKNRNVQRSLQHSMIYEDSSVPDVINRGPSFRVYYIQSSPVKVRGGSDKRSYSFLFCSFCHLFREVAIHFHVLKLTLRCCTPIADRHK